MPQITFKEQTIDYEIKRSRRAKRLKLAVHTDGRVVLTLPWLASLKLAERFIEAKAGWVAKQVAKFKSANFSLTKITKVDYLANKTKAKKLISERVAYFNQIYKFKINKITIKNQQTRWGSCSRQGNLNFNFRLIFLPQILADYIVVHELCHLRELNHSPRFWALVAKTFPNYKMARQDLKRAGLSLM